MTLRSWAGNQLVEGTRYWWLLLVSGSLWVLLSLAILQFDLTSVWSIAVMTGIVLCMAALTEFGIAAMAPNWRWAHALLGVAFVIGGIVAFAWPAETFVVLARLIGWYLLFLGSFEVVDSLSSRRTELWWLRLIAGIATIAIAFWAVHSLTRSATLLVLWVGIGALMHGITQFFMAFELRSVYETGKSMTGSREQVDIRHQGSPTGSDQVRPAGV